MVIACKLNEATRFLNTANRKIAGTERATPSNVISRASEMPWATWLAFISPPFAMSAKLDIMPLSVPSSPINGPSDPMTASILIRFSISTVMTSL